MQIKHKIWNVGQSNSDPEEQMKLFTHKYTACIEKQKNVNTPKSYS